VKVLLLAVLPGCLLWRGGDEARCPSDRILVITVQEDVAAFAGCKTASGLRVQTGATIDLAPLRDLQTVSGDIVVADTVGTEEVALDALVSVGGGILVHGNNSLRGLFLPRLETAGRVAIDDNYELTTIAMPRLAAVTGAVAVTANHDLALLAAPALVKVGGELVIVDEPALTLVEMGKLAAAQAVRIANVPKLAAETADELRRRTAIP
jgi:hypothetical protein